MKSDKPKIPFEKVGLIVTVAYFVLLLFLVIFYWPTFYNMPPNEWGDFLAGTLGPVALIWVVLGFFLQGRELGHSVQALNLQAEELRNSVEQQKEMVKITTKQLQLDINIRDEQTAATIAKELPDIRIDENKSVKMEMSLSAHGFRKYWMLHNVGADATTIYATMKKPDVESSYQNWGHGILPHSKSTDFFGSHGSKQAVDLDGAIITVISENLRGKKRKQVFRGNMFGVTEISCDPKRPK